MNYYLYLMRYFVQNSNPEGCNQYKACGTGGETSKDAAERPLVEQVAESHGKWTKSPESKYGRIQGCVCRWQRT